METNIGMSQQNRQDMEVQLSHLLANTYATYLLTQNAHWNITGPEFYSLHIMLDQQYKELQESVDETAERIRALGFYVDANFEAFIKLSAVKGEKRVLSAKEWLTDLLKAHELVIRELRNISIISDKLLDFATTDMVGRRLNQHEKFAWMIRSHL